MASAAVDTLPPLADDKREAVVLPGDDVPKEGEVELPYSIYSRKEKWIIVAMVALAGFYRYVCCYHLLIHSRDVHLYLHIVWNCQHHYTHFNHQVHHQQR